MKCASNLGLHSYPACSHIQQFDTIGVKYPINELSCIFEDFTDTYRIWSSGHSPSAQANITCSIGFNKIHNIVLINESPCVFQNVTYTDAESGVPLVSHFIAHAGDVPTVQRDGYEVCVP